MANVDKEDLQLTDEQAIASVGSHVKRHLNLMRQAFPSCHGYFDIRVQLVDGKIVSTGLQASYNTERHNVKR